MNQGASNKDLNLIQQGFGGKWSQWCVDVTNSVGQPKAVPICLKMTKRIRDTVLSSFLPNAAPMRNVTDREIDRRAELCVGLICAHYEAGWTTIRIHDELPGLLLEELEAKDKTQHKAGRWIREAVAQ